MTGDERFSESDLAPSPEERRAALRSTIDRAAATIAALAAGFWVGGLVALGACAAPFVFRLTPAPFSGHAMGAAFARFDQIAIGCAVLVLGAEVARTWAAGRRGRTVVARVRRGAAALMALCAAYVGLALTPQILALHRGGTRRGLGEDGALLEAIHGRAEAIGKLEALVGVALVALHVFTIAARKPEEDDDDDAPEPLPPGA